MRRTASPRGHLEDNEQETPLGLPSRQSRTPFAREKEDPLGDFNGRKADRGARRRKFLVWNPEKIVLLALFVGALTVGWFASTWLWQIELAGASQ